MTTIATDSAAVRTYSIDGKTPAGRSFSITETYRNNMKTISRRLEWHPFGGVGSVSIPMHAECWYGQLYCELTTQGRASDATANNCFMA